MQQSWKMAAFVAMLQILLCLCITITEAQYDVPDVRVEALLPRGIRVSIPDEPGISLFAFHGKINEELAGREAGVYSVDIWKPKDGRWTYVTKGPKLKVGDVVYYWVNVDFDDGNGKRGYIKDDQNFTVIELVPDETVPQIVTTTEDAQCKKTTTIVNGHSTCKGELLFQDQFKSLSGKKWRHEVKFAQGEDLEFVIYQNNLENIYVQRSMLHIKPTLTESKYGIDYVSRSEGLDLGVECTGISASRECFQIPRAWQILPPVISAEISTKNHFSFVYGSVEIRAKLPMGDWIYPVLRLRSKNDDYGPGYDSGEIRIAFVPGNLKLSKTLYGGCILGHSTIARSYAIKDITSVKSWCNDFHVYRVDWKEDRITVSVDGQVYGNIYPPTDGFGTNQLHLDIKQETTERWRTGTNLAPFDKEMYLSIGVGVGGQNFPNDIQDKPWDNTQPKSQLHFYRNQSTWSETWNENSQLVVDYVKIWAL